MSTIPTITLGQRVGVRWGFDGSGVEMRFAGQVVGLDLQVDRDDHEYDAFLIEVDPMVTEEPLRIGGFEVFEAKGQRIAVVPVDKVSDAGEPARIASFGWLD